MTNEKIKDAAKLGYALGSSSLCIFPWHSRIFPIRKTGIRLWGMKAWSRHPYPIYPEYSLSQSIPGHSRNRNSYLEVWTWKKYFINLLMVLIQLQWSCALRSVISDLTWEKSFYLEMWMYMCICFLTVDVGTSRSVYAECSFAVTYEMGWF